MAVAGRSPGALVASAADMDPAPQVRALDPGLGYDPGDTGSLGAIEKIVGADRVWAAGVTGKGVDVALIDTGVSPVTGLTSGNLMNGPDLSFDSQRPDLRYLDAHGHGTHLASIIAGRDAAGPTSGYDPDNASFTGIAPDSRIVNLKVGATDGAVDVSQVIAAINWVTENAQQHGLNIRVINLAYGTDSTQDQLSDPLAYAVDQAWRKGIVVVVAAGNDGTTKEDLADPAVNPNILAVGASDPNGTLQTGDDTLAAFSDRGTKKRSADVVAPGTHVLGLRVPDGLVDQANPTSRVGTRYTRGSGTSQAAAVVSGAAALLLSAYPTLTPNQVKGTLQATAGTPPLDTPKPRKMGAGIIDVAAATAEIAAAGPAAHAATLAKRTATGTGTLERARGSAHVVDSGTTLTGERDIFGRPWTANTWAASVKDATSWSQGRWNGSTWTGTSWTTAVDWNTPTWKIPTWTGTTWAGTSWAEHTWDTSTWAGGSWDGRNWGDESWAGTTWTGRLWASFAWS